MRRTTLLLALAVLLAAVPGAQAQGGAAQCRQQVKLDKQRISSLVLVKGAYRITVEDTADLTCGQARQYLTEILAAPGATLPPGWQVDLGSRTFARKDGSDTFSVAIVPPPAVAGGGFSWSEVQDWAILWLPIIFLGVVAFAILWMLRYMPRTKPQEIKPSASGAVRWDEVAGVEESKDELREVVDFLRDPKRFRKLGARVPRGILLHGPPGTGKTLLAKAVAHESNATFFAQSASSFVEMFAGLGAARIRRLFRQARKETPAIIFIDELDAVGATRGNDVSGEKDQTLNQLLVELDGFGGDDNVVVIAASNLLEKLDPALLRPGRFDRQILVSPPDVGGREEIMRVHTRSKPLGADVDLATIARQTSGLAGADLANICNEAAIFAARAHRRELLHADFDSAVERVVAGMQSRRTLTEHERRVVAWHEGHALCAELLPGIDRVHKISIVPRG